MVEGSTPVKHRATARWCLRLLALVGGAFFIWCIGVTSASAVDLGSTVTRLTDTAVSQAKSTVSKLPKSGSPAPSAESSSGNGAAAKAVSKVSAAVAKSPERIAKATSSNSQAKAAGAISKTSNKAVAGVKSTVGKATKAVTALPIGQDVQAVASPVVQVLSTTADQLPTPVDHVRGSLLEAHQVSNLLPSPGVSTPVTQFPLAGPSEMDAAPGSASGLVLPENSRVPVLTGASLVAFAPGHYPLTPGKSSSAVTSTPLSDDNLGPLDQALTVLAGIGGALSGAAIGSDFGGAGSLLAITSGLAVLLGLGSVRTPWLGGHVPVQPHLIQVTPD